MISKKDNFGGGSGGGVGDMDDTGNTIQSTAGTFQIGGNQVVLLSRPALPPAKDGPSLITILAVGKLPTGAEGCVDVRGGKGVRITAGHASKLGPLTTPPVHNASTDGVEIVVSEGKNVTVQRGVFPGGQIQKIEMTPDNITIDAGMTGKVTIKAGINSITIDAKTGITIKGLPFVKIN